MYLRLPTAAKVNRVAEHDVYRGIVLALLAYLPCCSVVRQTLPCPRRTVDTAGKAQTNLEVDRARTLQQAER